MRSKIIWVAVSALAACGGSAGPGGTPQNRCTVILSGALSGSFNCSTAAFGSWSSGANQSTLGFGVNGTASTPAVGVGLFFAGPMHTGTYKSTDAGANGAVSATPNSSSSQTWTAAAGSSSQGSYTMSLTDLGSSVALGSGLAYPGVHGTLDATLPAAASTGASGTVTLHAVF